MMNPTSDSESNFTAPSNSQSDAPQTATSDVSLAQRIWTRYGNSPGVISSGPSQKLVERVQRLSDGQIPLLADLQRRLAPANLTDSPFGITQEYKQSPIPMRQTKVFRSSIVTEYSKNEPETNPNQTANDAPIMPVLSQRPMSLASQQVQRQLAGPGESNPTAAHQLTGELGPAIRRYHRAGVSTQNIGMQEASKEVAKEQPSLNPIHSISPTTVLQRQTFLPNGNTGESGQFPYSRKGAGHVPPIIQAPSHDEPPTLAVAPGSPPKVVFQRQTILPNDDTGETGRFPSSRKEAGHVPPIIQVQSHDQPPTLAVAPGSPPKAVIQRQTILPNSDTGESDQFPYSKKDARHRMAAQELPLVKGNGLSKNNFGNAQVIQPSRLISPALPMPLASAGPVQPIIQAQNHEEPSNNSANRFSAGEALVERSSSMPEINLDEIADKVLKKILRYLAVENERKGRFR